jgi:predicted nuclease of predicted toxin-antitoxin system
LRFLIHNALSPVVAEQLQAAGHEAVHVRDYGLQAATDEVIFERAAVEDRILVSADTDFGMLLATRQATSPSVVLFRHGAQHRPEHQVDLLKANLEALDEQLQLGCIVVLEPDRVSVRALPLVARS